MSDKLTINGQIFDAVYFHKPEQPFGFLSNWYFADFIVDGVRYNSTEQYIMYQKALLFGDPDTAEAILKTRSASKQQKLGRKVAGYMEDPWAGIRQLVAVKGNLAKFSQNEDLKRQLLDTGDAWLVECAPSDKVWSCGLGLTNERRFDAKNWDGQSILGFALMEVRERLRSRTWMAETLDPQFDYDKYIWQIQFRPKHYWPGEGKKIRHTTVDFINRAVIVAVTDRETNETKVQRYDFKDDMRFDELMQYAEIARIHEFEEIPESKLKDHGYRDGWRLDYSYFTKEAPHRTDGFLSWIFYEDPVEQIVKWIQKTIPHGDYSL